jgi:hypothetical protein
MMRCQTGRSACAEVYMQAIAGTGAMLLGDAAMLMQLLVYPIAMRTHINLVVPLTSSPSGYRTLEALSLPGMG